MKTPSEQARWMGDVVDRPGAMTQRKRSVVESWPGGIDALLGEARSRGVHLVELTDDRGTRLIAASIHPFTVLR